LPCSPAQAFVPPPVKIRHLQREFLRLSTRVPQLGSRFPPQHLGSEKLVRVTLTGAQRKMAAEN
jgi:hypothetical protein